MSAERRLSEAVDESRLVDGHFCGEDMSPPQLRGGVMTGVSAVRRARFGVVRPLKAGPAGELAADGAVPAAGGDPGAGRYRAAGQALQCLRGGGRGSRHHDACRPATEPLPIVADDPDHDGHLERSARAQSHPLPGSTRRRRGADQRARDASAELAGQAGEWTRQGIPAAVTAATAKTPLQIMCPRRGSGPAAFTAKTPKSGPGGPPVRPKPRRQSRYVTRLPAILAELCRIVHR